MKLRCPPPLLAYLLLGSLASAGACTSTVSTGGTGGSTATGSGGSGTTGEGGARTTASASVSSSESASSSGGAGSTATASASVSSSASASSSSASASSSSASTGAGGGNPMPVGQPPDPGAMNPGDGIGSVTFAVSKLLLGDTNPDGTSNKVNGWKQYGYNLDGKVSTPQSVDLCKPVNNASPQSVYPDGTNGIDNSFGRNILPILFGLTPDVSNQVNASLASGSFTLLFDLQKLGGGGDYNPLVAREYTGAPLGAPPQWNGNDVWPVTAESLNAPPDVTSAKVVFSDAYVVGNTWVGHAAGEIEVPLFVAGFPLPLRIDHAVVSMDLDASHTFAKHGILAGILSTAAFTADIKKVAGSFDPTLCSGSTINSIVSQIQQASDIGADGGEDPSKSCDGISIGLGFEAKIVKLGASAPPIVPPPDPCAP